MKSHHFLFFATLLFVLISSASVTWTTAVASDRLDDKHLKQLLLRIYDKTGMSIPDMEGPHFPKVVFVTQQYINGIVCKKRECNAQAATKEPKCKGPLGVGAKRPM